MRYLEIGLKRDWQREKLKWNSCIIKEYIKNPVLMTGFFCFEISKHYILKFKNYTCYGKIYVLIFVVIIIKKVGVLWENF